MLKTYKRVCACGCQRMFCSHSRRTRFIQGHQHLKVQYVVDKKTGCWNWLLSKDSDGYGWCWWAARKQMCRAHIVFYVKKYGSVPDGKQLDHVVCKNKGCCNPDHVEPVTQTVNVRRGKGTKLPVAVACAIRKAARHTTQVTLARRYGVHQTTIARVVKIRTWKEAA